tara:strand:- start:261 stop:545 length:285 start_codon:yes stop_codon:yes gene_type:complete
MLKSIKSNYLPARPYNRHTSVVDLSTDFSAGNISKRNNKMNKQIIEKLENALKTVTIEIVESHNSKTKHMKDFVFQALCSVELDLEQALKLIKK